MIDMTSLAIRLPHPSIHLVSDAARATTAKLHAAYERREHHECKRYEFLEDALLSREMKRL
ncbi:unnamed protein product [Mycolicibacterium canariasense]|uniref:Uncharacterized protein n=1 Tax=Mycolicibacterium canariasense TaxID=228230 RepID=A0A124E284_MYCCR|nr:hypothetical protein [Mycolicibacterium canariasense]MCV7207916.1 hypothetical protein [Mycolicibacterium canariasense]GAS96018.1 unnamed protein product [Mycolicibacterium canariasense]